MNQHIDASLTDKTIMKINAERRRLIRLKARRKGWLKVHLYLGLFLGVVLFINGLTGSILTFWLEIDRWLNPELMIVEVPEHAVSRPMAEIVSSAKSALPPTATLTYAYPSHKPNHAYYFFYNLPSGDEDNNRSINVFVNPYTSKVIGTRAFYSADSLLNSSLSDYCLMGFILKLHYAMLAGKTGNFLVGILGVIFIISVLTGLILWWPLTGKWRQALTLKRRASVERFNYDLHKIIGFYSAIVLIAVLLSGVSFNLYNQFIGLVDKFSPVTIATEYKTQPMNDQSTVTADQAWKLVKNHFPNGYLYLFSVPNSDTGIYVFNVIEPLDYGFHGRWKILVDRYGKILHTFGPLSGSGGNVFLQWMWPLHSGYALGITGRILVLLSGIACAVLFITGIIRWLQKRHAKNFRS